MVAVVIIDHKGSLMNAYRQTLSFGDKETALTAYGLLRDAAREWVERSNTRAEFVEIEELTGPTSINVSSILSVSMDCPTDADLEVLTEWNRKMYASHGRKWES